MFRQYYPFSTIDNRFIKKLDDYDIKCEYSDFYHLQYDAEYIEKITDHFNLKEDKSDIYIIYQDSERNFAITQKIILDKFIYYYIKINDLNKEYKIYVSHYTNSLIEYMLNNNEDDFYSIIKYWSKFIIKAIGIFLIVFVIVTESLGIK